MLYFGYIKKFLMQILYLSLEIAKYCFHKSMAPFSDLRFGFLIILNNWRNVKSFFKGKTFMQLIHCFNQYLKNNALQT